MVKVDVKIKGDKFWKWNEYFSTPLGVSVATKKHIINWVKNLKTCMRYGKTKSAMLGTLILVCAKYVLHTNKFHVFEHSVNKHFKHFICFLGLSTTTKPFKLKQIGLVG
jgi:hypothetical protein